MSTVHDIKPGGFFKSGALRAFVNGDEAMKRLRALLAPILPPLGLKLGVDDLGSATVFARRDMTHLDADALHDRLHAWTVREVAREVPHASALLNFRHARPATADEATRDLQELWHDLEPTFRLELVRPNVKEEELAAFARLVPEFARIIERHGRPEGWRKFDVGNVE